MECIAADATRVQATGSLTREKGAGATGDCSKGEEYIIHKASGVE